MVVRLTEPLRDRGRIDMNSAKDHPVWQLTEGIQTASTNDQMLFAAICILTSTDGRTQYTPEETYDELKHRSNVIQSALALNTNA